MSFWLYGAVARRQVVLAECVLSDGHFDRATPDFLLRLDPAKPLTSFAGRDIRYFCLQTESGLSFVVIGYASTHPRRAQQLLDELAEAFTADPATARWKEAPYLGLQAEFGQRFRQLLTSGQDSRPSEALLASGNVLESLGPEQLTDEARRPRPQRCRFSRWTMAVAGLLAIAVLAAVITVGASGQ